MPGVVPYDLNTPLFSDYAQKTRFAWVPPGASATWDARAAIDLPAGSFVVKTFAFAPDMRDPSAGRRLVETRVLYHAADGWRGWPYVWDDAETDAAFSPGGEVRSISLVTPAGKSVTAAYLVPSMGQCQRCHADAPGEGLHLLGSTARNLNRDFAFADGAENQIARWSRLGLLAGAPAPAAAPRLAAWDDPATGTPAERARALLEVNCAFCHGAGGLARSTGLFLGTEVTDPYALGLCKTPVAAGPGSGGLSYDVVPGDPDRSILVHRMAATEPGSAMPQIGRSLVHEEGLALVREWVAGLTPAGCP
jgi:uncharacterized repeat protein (TIGR03806 family)